MQLNTYLVFNGQCEAAFKFYEQVLGGKILAMFTHAGTPAAEQVPPEWLNKIMHVTLKAGDTILMGSDAPPDHFKTPQGFSVNIAVEPETAAATSLATATAPLPARAASTARFDPSAMVGSLNRTGADQAAPGRAPSMPRRARLSRPSSSRRRR